MTQQSTKSMSKITENMQKHTKICKQMFKEALFFFCLFLGPHPWHMEVPTRDRIRPQLLAYATDTATWDPSQICELHHSSQQRQISDPLSEARDRILILMDTSQIHFRCATMGTPTSCIL